MQKFALFTALLLLPFLVACGNISDKFSRINGSFTRVHFSGREDSLHQATVDGGIGIYFINALDSSNGRAFIFPNKEDINSKTVVLPNGQYRVFVYGWDGPSAPFIGATRCGRGDNGAVITLSGASTTVSINLDPGNCQFGYANEFAAAEHGNVASDNFDTLDFVLCNGSASSYCSSASSSSWYLKTELLGGIKNSGSSFTEIAGYNLSTCTATSSSAYISTGYKVPIGGSLFSPPVRFSVYTTPGCSGTASGTYSFPHGLKEFVNAASGSTYYVDVASSGSTYRVNVGSFF